MILVWMFLVEMAHDSCLNVSSWNGARILFEYFHLTALFSFFCRLKVKCTNLRGVLVEKVLNQAGVRVRHKNENKFPVIYIEIGPVVNIAPGS